jgi:hypothetical protein
MSPDSVCKKYHPLENNAKNCLNGFTKLISYESPLGEYYEK